MRRRVRIANPRRAPAWVRLPLALVCGLLVAAPSVGVIVGVTTYARLTRGLPPVPDLAAFAREAARTSRILAADGTVLAELPFAVGPEVGHRDWVTADELPPVVVDAILAAEDVRFFGHDGVDLQAVARAVRDYVRHGRPTHGASTISQQLARNLLPVEIGRAPTLERKLREMVLARRLERRHDKRMILEAYVNYVFLGANAYGLAAGARAYFDRPLAEVTLAEAAFLAGLIQAPSRLAADADAARARRDEVLARMHRAGLIDDGEHAEASAAPVALRPPTRPALAPWMTELVRRRLAAERPAALARGGLVVETTVLPVTTTAVEAAARDATDGIARRRGGPPPEVAIYALDHVTGYVEAIVGGRDHAASQFERATQACRQPGSAMKPLVYAAAIEANVLTPGTPLRDAPVSEWDERRGVHWKPRTGGHAFRGVVLAREALAGSLNAPAIDVLERVGGGAVLDLARRLGLTTELDPVRPLVLGASCVVPAELTVAYATLARGGRPVAPVVIRRVIGPHGGAIAADAAAPEDPFLAPARRLDRLVARAASTPPEGVVDPVTAYLVADMLAEVVRSGTGRDARRLGRPAAGKTGTTNHNTDAWFVGWTARLAVGVWLGHDDPARGLGKDEDGRRAALPLWLAAVATAEGERPARPVPGAAPPGVERARVDRETGRLAPPGRGVELPFRAGTAPRERAEAEETAVPRELDRAAGTF